MNFNNSFDNTENSSNIKTILEQIKKKTEEISTSEASMKFLSNLSNPTNLTNPLIINSLSKKSQDTNKFYLPSLKSRRIIMKIKNEIIPQKFISRSNSNILSRNHNISFLNEPVDLKNYQNLFEKAEKELLDIREKKRIKNILQKLNRESDISKNDNSNIIINNRYDNSENNNKIWAKLKHSKSYISKKEKDSRINYLKFIPKKKAIDKCNNIRLMHYIRANKNEHYKNYLSMKNAELKSTDNMLKKIQDSKDFLENKFEEQYKSYVHYLDKTFEKENKKNNDIIKKKLYIMNDINKLKMKIEKIKNNKTKILDWVYLQIRMRKRKPILPIYYKQILEDNIPYKNINRINIGKYRLDIKEYNEIYNYKNQPLYDDVDEMVKDLNQFQLVSLDKNIDDPDSFNIQLSMNSELKELIKQNQKIEERYNEKYKKLTKELKILKTINQDLEIKLIQLKAKKAKTKTRVYKDKFLLNKFSLFSIININQELVNFILTNNKSTLFNLSLCLYHMCMLYDTSVQSSTKLNLDFNKGIAEIMFMIFKCASFTIDLLKQEKKDYFSNKESRLQYVKIKNKVDKELIKEKTQVKIEMQKKADNIKIEKLKEKVNKKYFKRLNKVDYFKIHKKFVNQSLDLDNKRKTKFEDFLYDIDS